MSKKLIDKFNRSRRRFMARFATGAGGVAVFGVSKTVYGEASVEDNSQGAQAQLGYHETDHIRTYYKKAAF